MYRFETSRIYLLAIPAKKAPIPFQLTYILFQNKTKVRIGGSLVSSATIFHKA